jgi:hypothetical protein
MSRVRKQNEGQKQQLGPMKAILPVSSILRQHGTINAISPPFSQGHRSPGAMCYKGKTIKAPSDLRRTASLDNLRPFVNDSPYTSTSLLHLDKATQTDESFLDKNKPVVVVVEQQTPSDMKMEKVIRQRQLQRTHRENSVSSQTNSQSPMHSKAVSIPPRCPPPNYMRPMRNSVEGLNQEIEKLVLYPGQPHTCRRENSHMVSVLK